MNSELLEFPFRLMPIFSGGMAADVRTLAFDGCRLYGFFGTIRLSNVFLVFQFVGSSYEPNHGHEQTFFEDHLRVKIGWFA